MADVTKNAEDAMRTLADVRENVLDVMGKKWNLQWRGEFKQSSAKAGQQNGGQSKQGVDVVSRCAARKNHLRHQNHSLSANKTKQKKG